MIAAWSPTAVIAAHTKVPEWLQAMQILASLRASHTRPDVLSCNCAISSCARGAVVSGVLSLLRSMRLYGPPPNVASYGDVRTYVQYVQYVQYVWYVQ